MFRSTLRGALALAGLAVVMTAAAADAKPATERLVVRGEALVVDAPCPAGICLELADGTFRGTPVGSGVYSGSVQLRIADAFANGEGGVCAPIRGEIVLGAGTPNRLVLAVGGDSCQDGAGNPGTSSFTGLARFKVKHGTGAYAGATGSGTASFLEDAADRDHMTLVGRISR